MADKKTPFPSIDTPAVLIDLDQLDENINNMSFLAREAGLRLRPHVKVHESALIAKKQIGAGAVGIEVGSTAKAEVMAEKGISDIVIAHPAYYGGPKEAAIKRLLAKPELKLTLVIDMLEQAEIISRVGESLEKKVSVLVKIDLGTKARFGIQPGNPLVEFVRALGVLPGIYFAGIYGHEMGTKPSQESKDRVALEACEIMQGSARLLRDHGLEVEHVTLGASSTFRSTCRYIKEGMFKEITEIHPGQCVIGDIYYMKMGGNAEKDIAVSVLTTVTSTSHDEWAMIDAGYKTFGAEAMFPYRDEEGATWQGMPRYGYVRGRPDLWFGRLSAETGSVHYMSAGTKLRFGERLEIVPNNATLVNNIHDTVYGIRNGTIEEIIRLDARGKGN